MRTQGRSRLRPAVFGIFALVLLVIVGGLAGVTVTDRQQTLEHAERMSQIMARLLEEHAKRTFDAADLVLDHMVAEAERVGMAAMGNHDLHVFSQRLQAKLPEQGSVWVHDAGGRAIVSSLAFPAPDVNIGDRPYFRAHADGARFQVGELMRGRLSGEPVFTLSRRITDDADHFAGIAVAPIRTKYFEQFWNSLRLGPNSVLALVRKDGAMVVRQSFAPTLAGSRLVGTPLFRAVAVSADKSFRAHSPIDGTERIYSYLEVRDYPVIALAGIAVEDALLPFWHRFWRNAGVAAAAMAGACALGWITFLTLRREEQTQGQLAQALAEQHEAGFALRIAKEGAEAAEVAAGRANLAKSKFLAAASHDLRQPVQSLFLFASVLETQLAGHPAAATLSKMALALEGLRSLLDSLLDVSRLEAGAVTPVATSFPIALLLRQMEAEYSLRALDKGLRLRVVDCSALVRSDRKLLEQMVRNLIENALRYTERGGIVVGCRSHGGAVELCVTDTGHGIPAESVNEIFEEFLQLGNPQRDRTLGLGLGLSIVRRLSHLIDHPVTVASQVGRGSTFRIRIPLAEKAPCEAAVT